MIKNICFVLLSVFTALVAQAQDSAVAVAGEQATGMRAEGKVYVVMAVVLTILAGLFIYLISLDRKISRLEKNS